MEEDRDRQKGALRLSGPGWGAPADGGAVYPHIGRSSAALLHDPDPGRPQEHSGASSADAGAGAL